MSPTTLTPDTENDVLYAQSCEEAPRVHPNGFIQLNLDESHDRRLHIWHPEVPSQGINTIHDHVFDMDSEVVVGEMVNKTYAWCSNYAHDQFNTHRLWRVDYHPGSFEAVLSPIEDYGFPEIDKIESVKAGESYYLPAKVFHVADNSEVCATVMTRKEKVADRSHIMLSRHDLPTEFTRSDAMPVEQMWHIIWEVLES